MLINRVSKDGSVAYCLTHIHNIAEHNMSNSACLQKISLFYKSGTEKSGNTRNQAQSVLVPLEKDGVFTRLSVTNVYRVKTGTQKDTTYANGIKNMRDDKK